MNHPSTLLELVEHRAQTHADRPLYAFVPLDPNDPITQRPFGDLVRRARGLAGVIQRHVEPGDRVLLLLPAGPDVVVALLASILAGVACVPLPATDHRRASFAPQARDAGARLALSDRATRARLQTSPGATSLRWIEVDAEDSDAPWARPPTGPDDLAWLQYTSGSTGSPRGVQVRHRNVLANSADIMAAWGLRAESRSLMWVPHYHDDGLVNGILQPLYAGFLATLMSPFAFIQRPERWLRLITERAITHAGGPNFTYEVCLRKVPPEARAGLDLASWEVAYNAAEPVRAGTLRRFYDAFAPHGLRWNTLRPAYGMAETTLLVTTSNAHTGPLIARFDAPGGRAVDLVSSGRVVPSSRLKIADPNTGTPMEPGEVGEILVAGPGVTDGYWQKPEATAATFAGAWLRTGDLGFLRDGELFVTGRHKDVIILAGANYYPQDIESAVETSDAAFRPGCSVAFTVERDDAEESVVVVAEVVDARPDDAPRLAERAQAALGLELGLRLDALVLLAPETILKTTSGKVRRQPTRAAFLAGTLATVAVWRRGDVSARDARTDLRGRITQVLARQLGVSPERVDPNAPFVALGLRSMDAASIAASLSTAVGLPVSPLALFQHFTVSALARHLAEPTSPAPVSPSPTRATVTENAPVAIVGMSCRFPGADDPDAFWDMLIKGDDAIVPVPEERWKYWSEHAPDIRTSRRLALRHGGFRHGIEMFDAAFFAIPPREAAKLDPQQRWTLELCWEALEDAGIAPDALAGTSTGVFVGALNNEYALRLFGYGPESMIDAYAGTGVENSILANRLSYVLDLRGPSLTVDTACSSSLVALHLAVQSLRRGESDAAIVVGTNLMFTPGATIMFSQAGALSRTGRSRPFDAAADGFVRSEGAGVVVLKTLARAQADGDRVRAVVRGSATVQDGRTNGIMAPNQSAQEATLRAALVDAGMSPSDVTSIEAHGTGTPLGDPIEATALGAVFAASRERPLWLGSAKANIGHLEGAAGVAGLIKATLSLERRTLPPLAHWRAPNPAVDFEALRLAVPTAPTPWEGPRVAGVSSFGFGGANAHVVLEAAPDAPVTANTHAGGPWVLPLSARSPAALAALAARWRERLASVRDDAELADLCHTAAVRRAHHPWRMAAVGRDARELAAKLDAAPSSPTHTPPAALLLCSGHGSQWTAMPGELPMPVFEEALAAALEAIRGVCGEFAWPLGEDDLDRVARVQPAIFAVQVALGAVWEALGLTSAGVLGYSMGEVAAACVAGALSLDDAARVIVARSQLLATVEGQGAMLAVPLPGDEVPLHDTVVAVESAPGACVLAGTPASIDALEARLAERGVTGRRVRTRVAFHSPQMDALCAPLADALRGITPRRARVPLWSTVTGAQVDGSELGPDYWARNLRATVRFSATVRAALATLPASTPLVELSPHPLLASPTRGLGPFIPMLRQNEPSLAGVAALYSHGFSPRWRALYPTGNVARAPTYPWQRERHWAELPPARTHAGHPLLGRQSTISPGETRRWTQDLSTHAWLTDHRLGDDVLIPASVTLEVALAVGQEALGRPVALHSVRFEAPFFPSAPPWTLELALTGTADGATFVASGPGGVLTRGEVRVASDVTRPPSLDVPRAHDVNAFYDDMRSRGLVYGPAFRAIQSLAVGDGEVVAELSPPDVLADSMAGMLAHPALLDAASQSAAAALPQTDGATFLPVGVERLRVAAPLRGSFRCVARTEATPDGARADLWLTDTTDNVLAEITGLELRRVTGHATDDRLYQITWEPSPSPAPTHKPAVYLIADAGDLAPRLAALLVEHGATIDVGPAPSTRPHVGESAATIVVDLRPHDLPVADDPALLATTTEAVATFATLTRALRDLRLVTVLRDGSIAGAAVAGAVRCARWERPDLHAACLHLAPDASIEHLAAAILAPDDQPESRLTATGRFVRRLTRARPAPRALSSIGTVLISGGLGALGLLAAEELARRGARSLVLVGRSSPTPATVSRLDALRASGCAVTLVQADVTDEPRLRGALGDTSIDGVVHTAGVLDDAPLDQLDASRVARVMAPKLAGALTLHRLAPDASFFTIYGSVAGLWGNPGQAAYAAANSALAAFAAWRSAQGRPTVCLDWGPWSEVGMAAREGALRWAESQGLGALTPAEGNALFGRLLCVGASQLGVVRVDWSRMTAAGDPLFERLAPRTSADVSTPEGAVRAAVGAVFQLAPERIELDTPLAALGMDSLIALDLRNRIRHATGVELPLQDILRGPPPRALVERVTRATAVPDVDALSDEEVEAMLLAMAREGEK